MGVSKTNTKLSKSEFLKTFNKLKHISENQCYKLSERATLNPGELHTPTIPLKDVLDCK